MTLMFDMRCRENGIEHRLTKIKHPWTNGQVERMSRTIKEATVQPYHYDRHDQPKLTLPLRLETPKGHVLRMQMLDFPAGTIQTQSTSENAGTKHLDWA
jgi:transposase InsO family protein